MDSATALALAFQLWALFSIAGALLLYLMWKLRTSAAIKPTAAALNNSIVNVKQPDIVLVTSADTALGLQLCTYLANKGCRVFAGMKDAQEETSLPAKLLLNWVRIREFDEENWAGSIIPVQLDVTRGDVLREAIVAMGARMCAGELGISAVINTSGSIFRGAIESQEVQQWEHMLKTNILGSLRVAKAFVSLLRPTGGRLIYLGAGAQTGKHDQADGLTAFSVSRVAVEKCAEELRKELQPYGVKVIALDTGGLAAEALYKAPERQSVLEDAGAPKEYLANILSNASLHVVERALWDATPHERYQLVSQSKFNLSLPCRSSLRLTKKSANANAATTASSSSSNRAVQNV